MGQAHAALLWACKGPSTSHPRLPAGPPPPARVPACAVRARWHRLLNPKRACTRWLAAPTRPQTTVARRSTARLTSLRRAPPSVRDGVHSPARIPGTCAYSWQGTPAGVPAPGRGLSAHVSSRARVVPEVLSINDRLHGPFRGPLEAAHARHRLNRWRRETIDSRKKKKIWMPLVERSAPAPDLGVGRDHSVRLVLGYHQSELTNPFGLSVTRVLVLDWLEEEHIQL